MLLIRIVAGHQLYQDDSQRPDVSLVTVLFIFHAFRTEIKKRATERTLPSTCHRLVKLLRDAEIGQLYKALAVDQHVVRLDISMHLF